MHNKLAGLQKISHNLTSRLWQNLIISLNSALNCSIVVFLSYFLAYHTHTLKTLSEHQFLSFISKTKIDLHVNVAQKSKDYTSICNSSTFAHEVHDNKDASVYKDAGQSIIEYFVVRCGCE